MRHSSKVHEAMQQALKELLALSPKELSDKLKTREISTIGQLMKTQSERSYKENEKWIKI